MGGQPAALYSIRIFGSLMGIDVDAQGGLVIAEGLGDQIIQITAKPE